MTLFASLFSGYTVIGVPNLAYRRGWWAVRKIPAEMMAVMGVMGTGSRLRRASLARNHTSPTDFITDRFGSQLLRYTILALQVIPAWIYLTAQLVSLRDTFNGMFNVDQMNPVGMLIIASLILVYEAMGGLSSVAWTDAIQGVIMFISFLLLPLFMAGRWGGWPSIDPNRFPRKDFYDVPEPLQRWLLMNYICESFGFFSLPHIVQRVYAAGSMRSLKAGYAAMNIGAWLTQFVGVYIGTMGIWILRDRENDDDYVPYKSPYSPIIEEVMGANAFGYVLGMIVFTGALAAIMSTADSVLIAISQLLTAEVLYAARPRASAKQVIIYGKLVSISSMTIAVFIAQAASDGLQPLHSMQFGMSLQTVPAYLLGLYGSDELTPHPWMLTLGALGGIAANCTVVLTQPANGPILNGGMTGIACNCFLILVGEVYMRRRHGLHEGGEAPRRENIFGWWRRIKSVYGRSVPVMTPRWDRPPTARFGFAPLTPQLLNSLMRGSFEPFLEPWFAPMATLLALGMVPMSGISNAAAGFRPPLINGIPDWVLKMLLFTLAFSLLVLITTLRLPDDDYAKGDEPLHAKDAALGLDSAAQTPPAADANARTKRAKSHRPQAAQVARRQATKPRALTPMKEDLSDFPTTEESDVSAGKRAATAATNQMRGQAGPREASATRQQSSKPPPPPPPLSENRLPGPTARDGKTRSQRCSSKPDVLSARRASPLEGRPSGGRGPDASSGDAAMQSNRVSLSARGRGRGRVASSCSSGGDSCLSSNGMPNATPLAMSC